LKAAPILDIRAVILAGGLGTRLGDIGWGKPKALVEVGGRPFLAWQLELLKRRGLRRFLICAGHLGSAISERFGSGEGLGAEIAYSFEADGRLLGTGGALRRAVAGLEEDVLVVYGDSYLDFDYAGFLGEFRRRDCEALMAIYRNRGRYDRSNVRLEPGGEIRYDKKNPDPGMEHIDYGASLLKRAVIESIPPDVPYDLADLYSRLGREGKLFGFEVRKRFYEVGSPAGLREFEKMIVSGRTEA